MCSSFSFCCILAALQNDLLSLFEPNSYSLSFAATSVLPPPSVVSLLRDPELAARFTYRASLA